MLQNAPFKFKFAPLSRGDTYVDDTIRGVIKSAERLLTAALAPVTAPIAALAHCQSGVDPRLNRAWVAWHTAACLLCRRHILGAFLPLWFVTGFVFVGYVANRARRASGHTPLYRGRRVVRSMSTRTSSQRRVSRHVAGGGMVGFHSSDDEDEEDEEEEEEEEDEEEEEVEVDDDRSTGVKAEGGDMKTVAAGLGMKVFGFEEDSEVELCRLRVRRWLQDQRAARARVVDKLAREERLEALQAQGKSAKAAVALLRRAEGGGGATFGGLTGGSEGGGGMLGVMNRRMKKPNAAAEEDVDDPIRFLLKRFKFATLHKIISSANPFELVIRVLQQVVWTLLTLLRSTGVTLFNVTVSLGQLTQIHRMLAGPCRQLCNVLDSVAEPLEALGGLLSWRDPHLSRHVAVTLVALAAATSLFLYVVVTPLWWFLAGPIVYYSHTSIPVRNTYLSQ